MDDADRAANQEARAYAQVQGRAARRGGLDLNANPYSDTDDQLAAIWASAWQELDTKLANGEARQPRRDGNRLEV